MGGAIATKMRCSSSTCCCGPLRGAAAWRSSQRKALSSASVGAEIASRGFMAPLPAISAQEAMQLREKLHAYEASLESGAAAGNARFKTHLLLTWVSALVRNTAVLDAVEECIGTDILVWSSGWAIKPAHSSGFYSWHQDSTYAGLVPAEKVVVAWIALTETSVDNGCVRYIPGSHKHQLQHVDTFASDNLLSRGQTVHLSEDDERTAKNALLRPGEFALHHFQCVHSSGPNSTDGARIGLQVVYMATDVHKKAAQHQESAYLVRGKDAFRYWLHEPQPQQDLGPAEREAHHEAMELENGNYFADSAGRREYHR